MGRDDQPDPKFDGLRRLVASDPKLARVEFASVLASDPDRLAELLEIASMPGEGRLRQMVATTARLNPDERLQPWLTRWLSVEADEFTKAAIEAAVGKKAAPKRTPARGKSLPTQSVEAYRYVSDRLCHRVRNTLTLPGAQFVRLQGCIESVEDPEVKAELTDILASLKLSYQRLARAVEFDTGDDYMAWADFDIVRWLERTASDFASRCGDATLTVSAPPGMGAIRVSATRFLLDTMIGNIWANAVQAAPAPCHLTFECSEAGGGKRLRIVVRDNGAGFNRDHQETAFQQAFSTKSASRGRGLLEMADAVAQLQGSIGLEEIRPGEFRIRIELPARPA